MLWEEPSCTVFRAKGILSIAGQANKFVLQCVGDLFDVQVPSVLKYHGALCVFWVFCFELRLLTGKCHALGGFRPLVVTGAL